jgi:hypothetical protein
MPFYIRPRRRLPLWKPTAIGAGAILVWTVTRGVISPGAGGGFLTGFLYTLLFPLLGGGLAALAYWLLGTPWVRPYLAARWAVGFVFTAAALFLLSAATTHPNFAAIARSSGSSGFVVSTLVLALVLGGVVGFELFSKGATERVYLTPAEYGALPVPDRETLRLEGESPVPP